MNDYVWEKLKEAARSKYFVCAAQNFTDKAKPGESVKVNVQHGISYNGGTVIDGKWYAGYEVPAPIVPEGYELVSEYVGSELNAHPPYVTMILRQKKREVPA